MAEGLSAAEVGKEISEHRTHSQSGGHDTAQDRRVTIIEAALLASVALLAAWSGCAADGCGNGFYWCRILYIRRKVVP